MIELRRLTIAEFKRRIGTGELILSEFYRELAAYIRGADRQLNAFEAFDPQLIDTRVRAVLDSPRQPRFSGGLFGVPIAAKDVINTIHLPTARGSAYWKGYVAGNNARIIDQIELEGGVIIGKTVTAELAVHHPGPTRNPHNPLYSPGTSSMGSAVAVSAGMALAALGTQTGSSIIRPASYTGVFGYKPSYGIIPRTGVLKTTDTLDHVGFFANHLEDLKLLLDLLRVRGANYPLSDRLLVERAVPSTPIVIGILRPKYLWKNYQGYVQNAFESLVRTLSRVSGIRVESIEDDGWFDPSHRIHATLYDKSLSYYFMKESRDRRVISSTLAAMVDHGNAIGVSEFQSALADQARMQREFDERYRRFDLILTPSTANIAPARDAYKEVDDTGLIASLLGIPSVNLPVFKGPDDMPFGLQALGVKYSDYRVLAALHELCRKELINPCSGVSSRTFAAQINSKESVAR